MIRRGVCLVTFLGVGLVPAFPADPAPAQPAPAAQPGQFDSLIKNSPFGQAAAAGPQAGSGNSSLEFRGVFLDHGDYFFSLHETASRAGAWVGLKEAGQPYVVESYDPDKGSIQVKYRGQALTLSLKLAQVIVQAPSPITQAPPGVNPAPVPAIASAPTGDEAVRMAQVAEEIRRRRALRTPTPPVPIPISNQPRPAAPSARP